MLIASIQAAAGLYILYASIIAMNKMSRATPHAMRYANIALGASSTAMIASSFAFASHASGATMIASGSGFASHDIFECLSAIGIALYIAGNRRASGRVS